MKTIIHYMLPFILALVFSMPAAAQTSNSGGEQAQSEMKAEQKREKQRRKRATKSERRSEQVSTTPRHGWLFSKKRKKNAPKSESVH
ncbi:MAG: hypothetical protein JWO44_967 [Bacteroidetes bacterium]|jgi:hypothetical protein|nr:hypothetical protein [Bacteroidota bacterium]